MHLLRKLIRRLVHGRQKSFRERYPQYQIGKGTYGFPHVRGEGAALRIGAYCSIAPQTQIFLGGEHRTDWVTTYPFSALWEAGKCIKGHPRNKGDVTVGNDVWIGREAVIMSGVNIGDGAVIGARAMVTRDVPPYAIVGGNPACIVRMRFDEEIIQRLLNIRWWHWDDERIEMALPMLLDDKIEAFLEAAEKKLI